MAQSEPRTVPLEPIDRMRLKRILSENKGRVILFNFWATWCSPCRDEFPELMRIYGTYREKGLLLIFLSLDEQDQKEAVKGFLQENNVNFESYIHSGEDFESLVNSIDPKWTGAVPATFIFGRQGKRIKTLLGAHNYEVFEKAIRPLL